MGRRIPLALVLVLLVGVAACSDEPTGTETTSEASIPATDAPTTAVPASTVPDVSATEPVSTGGTTTTKSLVDTPLEVETTRDIRYHEDIEGLRPPLVDVYAPAEGESWPVVVMFHGGDGQFQDKGSMEAMARMNSAEGAVVFAPTIGGVDEDAMLASPAKMLGLLAEAACATSFAVEHAERFGADPSRLSLYGFSAGARAAGVVLWGGVDVGADCLVDSAPPTPDTAVFFEGDWLVAPNWDDALDTGGLAYDEITVWSLLDNAAGTDVVLVMGTDTNESPQHRVPLGDIWSDTECGRDADGWTPQGGTCRYLELRDPGGGYRRDMERLDQLDDGFGDVAENSVILADRLEQAGHPATLVTIEGLSHLDGPQERAELVGPVIIQYALS